MNHPTIFYASKVSTIIVFIVVGLWMALHSYRSSSCISCRSDFENNTNWELENSSSSNSEKSQLFEIRFQNIHVEYRYDFTDSCPNSTNLLLLTMSRRDGFEKRKGVRQTWMADALNNQKLRFLIADNNENPENPDVLKGLKEEQASHGDLVFIHGFTDTYQHLHLKWYAGLQWQQEYCPNVEWVVKADDDTVVDLRRLDFWIDRKFRKIVVEHPLVFMGHMYIPESLYPAEKWPDYVMGFEYLTNPATIAAVLAQSPNCVGFFLDDVLFTGILAEKANVTRIDAGKHFIWDIVLDDKQPNCEEGVPTAVSFYGSEVIKDFENNYRKIKSLECTK